MVLIRYVHTLRHLKPCQVYGRILRPGRIIRPSESLRPAIREEWGRWVAPARREASMTGPGRFRFLNDVRDLDGMESWNDAAASKLWLYNLHYFDDLNSEGAPARRGWHLALIRRWVEENPPASGNGWEPYPTSLRIVNWAKWALGGNVLPREAVHSLAVQARWLERNLETHLLGNHLFANAKALVFAGAFFQGEEAGNWLRKGIDILRSEVPEQVLPDGGHFERSPMYHSLILEDLLDLINVSRAYPGLVKNERGVPVRGWENAALRMRRWLMAMVHPDGEIALFNDAAFGIAPSPEQLEGYANRLGLHPVPGPSDGITHLRDSGYVMIRNGHAVALLDVAPLGPDYLPAHGHADTLSFELSVRGFRVIVDAGTSCYEERPERLYQRSTTAHNTVVVDGKDSSEVWGSFRVARRAKPTDVKVLDVYGVLEVECAHDGYRRLPGGVEHRRRWTMDGSRLRIEDALSGEFQSARAGFLIHPEVAERSGLSDCLHRRMTEGELALPGGAGLIWRLEAGDAQFEPAQYYPEFGLARDTVRLVVDFTKERNALELVWT